MFIPFSTTQIGRGTTVINIPISTPVRDEGALREWQNRIGRELESVLPMIEITQPSTAEPAQVRPTKT